MKSEGEKGDAAPKTSAKEHRSLSALDPETEHGSSKTSYLSSKFFGRRQALQDGAVDAEKENRENRTPHFVGGLRKRIKTSSSAHGGLHSCNSNGFVPFPSSTRNKRSESSCDDNEDDKIPSTVSQDFCIAGICSEGDSGEPKMVTNKYDSPQTPCGSGQDDSDSFFKKFSYTPATSSQSKQDPNFGKLSKCLDISRPMILSVRKKPVGCHDREQTKRRVDRNANNKAKGALPTPSEEANKPVGTCPKENANDMEKTDGVNIFLAFQFRGFEY